MYCLFFKDPDPKDPVDFVLIFCLIEKNEFVNVEKKFIEEITLSIEEKINCISAKAVCINMQKMLVRLLNILFAHFYFLIFIYPSLLPLE